MTIIMTPNNYFTLFLAHARKETFCLTILPRGGRAITPVSQISHPHLGDV